MRGRRKEKGQTLTSFAHEKIWAYRYETAWTPCLMPLPLISCCISVPAAVALLGELSAGLTEASSSQLRNISEPTSTRITMHGCIGWQFQFIKTVTEIAAKKFLHTWIYITAFQSTISDTVQYNDCLIQRKQVINDNAEMLFSHNHYTSTSQIEKFQQRNHNFNIFNPLGIKNAKTTTRSLPLQYHWSLFVVLLKSHQDTSEMWGWDLKGPGQPARFKEMRKYWSPRYTRPLFTSKPFKNAWKAIQNCGKAQRLKNMLHISPHVYRIPHWIEKFAENPPSLSQAYHAT